jgi:hypothetical protein
MGMGMGWAVFGLCGPIMWDGWDGMFFPYVKKNKK